MTELATITPEAQQKAEEANAILVKAESFVINSVESFNGAADELKSVKAKKKELENQRVNLKEPILEAGRKIDSFFKKPIEFLDKAERIIKSSMLKFQDEQERIRKEEERKAQEEQDRLRKEAEEKAMAEIEAGNEAEAEAILEKSESIVVPAAYVPQAKVSGISKRDNWKGEVTDLKALIVAVAEGKAPITMIQANTTVINQMARSIKNSVSYPGVKFYNDPSISARV